MNLRQATIVWLSTVLIATGARVVADETSSHTNAPTGVYVSLRDMPERFTLHLLTNGTYTVLATGLMSTNSQSGVWHWDGAKQQFSLKPHTNRPFPYELRLLRFDQRHTDTLQWIPLRLNGPSQGAVDYVRFKRETRP